jgi:16S rRNA G966 N2-methylase RsmD
VGLEALSRGAEKCHFIEMEPWVVTNVLRPNLVDCNVTDQCTVHIMKAEEYLERALAAPEYATSFDFIRCAHPTEVFSDSRFIIEAENWCIG